MKIFYQAFTVLLFLLSVLSGNLLIAQEVNASNVDSLAKSIESQPDEKLKAKIMWEVGRHYGNSQKYEEAISLFHKAIPLPKGQRF
ncbi:hypothetical protein [Olivibacter sitiensis]|uniref:hypothetical protein n=1 Tax=Olivibacter sitiensis TaxID=376470 RepID=UPI0004299BF4|nr:hypothetical protein [Olivibacter sitiensis]